MVTRQDKRLAVGRLGALVEQIEALVSKDLQVILVRRPPASLMIHPLEGSLVLLRSWKGIQGQREPSGTLQG